MTIAEFLLARIAEDEDEAAQMGCAEYYDGGWSLEHEVHIRKECAAKRELVDIWHDEHGGGHVLKTLASIYSEHSDYQEEWKL